MAIDGTDKRQITYLEAMSWAPYYHPSGDYIVFATNQAEKAANITLIDCRAVGAFGRLIISGSESDVDEAAAAAIHAVKNPSWT